MKIRWLPWRQGLLMLVVLLSASACGFHLRTYNFSGAVDTFAVSGRSNLDIATQVRRGLQQAGLVGACYGLPFPASADRMSSIVNSRHNAK